MNADAAAPAPRPTRSPTGRRAWAAVAAIGLATGLVALAACGDDDDNNNNSPAATTTTPPASSATTATEDSMMTHDSSMTSTSG